MYARLSPETVSFINRRASQKNDINYREALNRYSEEITHAIREVCLELISDNILENDWSISLEDEDEVDEQLKLNIRQEHSSNYFQLRIDHNFNCYWSYNCPGHQSIVSENLKDVHPSFKRYFEIQYNQEHGTIIQATFSKRQLVSRYLVDYIVHLSRQLSPLLDQLSDPIRAVAA